MRYRDTRTGATYEPKTEFAAEQMAVNPALVPLGVTVPQGPDLSARTLAALRALCEDRGIKAPKKATKAQLVALLE